MRTAKRGGGTSPNPPPNLQTQLHARTAMGALEAAIERVGGEAGAAARDAAARGHAGEALVRLSRFFEEEAAAKQETATHALSLARDAARFAGTTRAAATLNAS